MPIRSIDSDGIETVTVDTTGFDPEEAIGLSREIQKSVRAGGRKCRFRHVDGRSKMERDEPSYGKLYTAEWMRATDRLGGTATEAQSTALGGTGMNRWETRIVQHMGRSAARRARFNQALSRMANTNRFWASVLAFVLAPFLSQGVFVLVAPAIAWTLASIIYKDHKRQSPKLKKSNP